MKKTLVLALAWLLLFFGAACLCARGMATSASYLTRLMEKHAEAGLDADEYGALSSALSSYFRGASDTPQIGSAYHDYELLHLADVRRLIALALPVGLVCLLLSAALAFLARKALLNKALPALGMAGGALALCCAAATLDFYRFFGAFHRLLFTNDLWLLDPRTDLLIQLMPEPFFRECALALALLCAAVCAVCAAAIIIIRKKRT